MNTLLDRVNWRGNAPKDDVQEKMARICAYILSDQWGIGDICVGWEEACKKFFGKLAIQNNFSCTANKS
jgi:hypothetical protein